MATRCALKCNFPVIFINEIPGNYYVNNYIPDLSKIPPVLESGDYMIECKVFDKDGKFLNGLQTYGQMIFLPSVAG